MSSLSGMPKSVGTPRGFTHLRIRQCHPREWNFRTLHTLLPSTIQIMRCRCRGDAPTPPQRRRVSLVCASIQPRSRAGHRRRDVVDQAVTRSRRTMAAACGRCVRGSCTSDSMRKNEKKLQTKPLSREPSRCFLNGRFGMRRKKLDRIIQCASGGSDDGKHGTAYLYYIPLNAYFSDASLFSHIVLTRTLHY